MTLRDLYLERLEAIARCAASAEAAIGYEQKLEERARLLQLQEEATSIAHCVARWGDINVAADDFDKLSGLAGNPPWEYRNPWLLGLSVAHAAS